MAPADLIEYSKYFTTMYCIVTFFPYICGMEVTKKGAQMRKGVLELCILSILSHNEMYSSDLLAALKEAQLLVVEGTIYPLLSRLKNEGLLKYRWEESPTGPPRKYFSLTEEGKSTQETLKSTWQQLSESVNRIIK